MIGAKSREKSLNSINAKFLAGLSAFALGLFLVNPVLGVLGAGLAIFAASLGDLTPAMTQLINSVQGLAGLIANMLPKGFGDAFKQTVASLLVGLVPAVNTAKNAFEDIGQASSKLIDQAEKNIARSDAAFKVAETDPQKSRVLDSSI